MTDIIDLIVKSCLLLFCFIPLHELGHYLMAKRNGWKNIKFTVSWWGFAVESHDNFEIATADDFKKLYIQLTSFTAMGGLFSIAGFVVLGYLNIVDASTVSLMVFLMGLYMIHELSTVPTVTVKETIHG